MSRFVHFLSGLLHFFVQICALFCGAAEERSLPISLRVTGGSSHPDTAAWSSDGGEDDDEEEDDDEDGGDGQ